MVGHSAPAYTPSDTGRERERIPRPPPKGARNYAPAKGTKVALGFLAFFFPMIPVAMVRGCNGDVLINFLLWLFGYIPGVIHALWIISRYTKPNPTKVYNVYYVNTEAQIPQPSPRRRSAATTMQLPAPQSPFEREVPSPLGQGHGQGFGSAVGPIVTSPSGASRTGVLLPDYVQEGHSSAWPGDDKHRGEHA